MTTLTDTQKQTIRIALAKWMGWRGVVARKLGTAYTWESPEGILHLQGGIDALPNYPTSLDACHAIEVKLTDEEHKRFRFHLARITDVGPAEKRFAAYVSAKAEHRALALYLSLNLGELGD